MVSLPSKERPPEVRKTTECLAHNRVNVKRGRGEYTDASQSPPSREEENRMPLAPRDFAAALLAEARETHPWLHHRLFRMIGDGELSRDQVRHVIREQGAFFLDTLRHAAWKIISVGGFTPTWEDLERQRALIPLVVEEGGHDTMGGKQTAHAYLFVRLCEGLGWSRDEVFSTEYLPTTLSEKDEPIQL